MDKVTTQFNNLVMQGKINKAKKVQNVSTVDFIKKGFLSKTIKYNKNMNTLTNDEINFSLLHEEGHYVYPIKIHHWIYLAVIFVIYLVIGTIVNIILLLYFIQNFIVGFVTALLILPLLILFIRIWLSQIYQDYEYKADHYACENVDNPIEIISIFDHLESFDYNKKNTFIRILLRILGSDLAHPAEENRIDEIIKFSEQRKQEMLANKS